MAINRRNILTLISLTLFGILISIFILDEEIKSFNGTEEESIVGIILSIRFFFMNLLVIGILIFSLIRLLRNKIFGYLFPISVCLIHFAIVLTLRIKRDARESSPIILQAHYDGDINGLTLFLRQNKTYKLSDFGMLGGTNYYGEYRIIGDTILLSEKYPLGKDRDIMSHKLVKRKEFILIKPNAHGVYSEDEYLKLKIVKSR